MANLRAAVITGGHHYDVPAFADMLAALDGIDAYPQSLENWAADFGGARAGYDVTVFFNMHGDTPSPTAGGESQRIHDAIRGLVEHEHGIVVLHHGLCAFRDWDFWATLVGIPDRDFRGFQMGQQMPMTIALPEHPIVAGLPPFTAIDETYDMNDARDAGILLTTDLPHCMKTIAWVRQQGPARVFCYQSGHDRLAYEDPSFRTILGRGIAWAARR